MFCSLLGTEEEEVSLSPVCGDAGEGDSFSFEGGLRRDRNFSLGPSEAAG
jgi:hypothetical protein